MAAREPPISHRSGSHELGRDAGAIRNIGGLAILAGVGAVRLAVLVWLHPAMRVVHVAVVLRGGEQLRAARLRTILYVLSGLDHLLAAWVEQLNHTSFSGTHKRKILIGCPSESRVKLIEQHCVIDLTRQSPGRSEESRTVSHRRRNNLFWDAWWLASFSGSVPDDDGEQNATLGLRSRPGHI